MSENISKAEKVAKTLKWKIVLGISERYIKVEDFDVPKEHQNVLYGYYDDYLNFQMDSNYFQYNPRILKVIQKLLLEIYPGYLQFCQWISPLILKFLNRKYRGARFEVYHVRKACEILETCIDIERQSWVFDCQDNEEDNNEEVLNRLEKKDDRI